MITSLIVMPDDTPGPHDVLSDFHMQFWLPSIGPTSIIALRLFGSTTPVGGVQHDIVELGVRLGLGGSEATTRKTLNRLESFNCGTFWSTDVFSFRTHLPALGSRQINRLPTLLQQHYTTHFLTEGSCTHV